MREREWQVPGEVRAPRMLSVTMSGEHRVRIVRSTETAPHPSTPPKQEEPEG